MTQYPIFYNKIHQSFDHIRNMLVDACRNRNNPLRTMNIAYVADRQPLCRTVVLRQCGENIEYLQFHTDYRSPKRQSLTDNPNIAAHFYDSDSKIQIAISGVASIHYQDAIAQEAWEKTQILSRRCYLIHSAPGTIIDTPDAGFDPAFENNAQTHKETEAGYAHFSVIRITVTEIDFLYLHMHGNRRIIFTAQSDGQFNGQWCIP